MKKQAHLPVDAVLPKLIDALRHHSAVVIQAPTGSGKTTRVPPALLRAGLLGAGQLLLLQPRRVAARACARTMARQMDEPLGGTVGYQIRFERKASRRTRILVVTEGILNRRFGGDPTLDGVACVILDEFHERSLHTDLALALLRELMSVRNDLKVVVMSATLDAEPVARFLFDAPIVSLSGRPHPLAISYGAFENRRVLPQACEGALDQLMNDPADDGGHILVFLPGVPEIRKVQRHLEKRDWPAEILPLHGSLSSAEQDRVLEPGSRRRIILATNIAQTSLTIEGVTAVVDSGFHKLVFHDAARGIDRLDTVRISRAAADQRAGRAGRTGPGRAVRLWSEAYQAMMSEQDPPEIARVDLTSLVLRVLDFHGPDLERFSFFEDPPPQAISGALTTLLALGAVDDNQRVNPLGRRLAELPLHPRVARVLESAVQINLASQGILLCAILHERRSGNAFDLFDLVQTMAKTSRIHGDPRLSRKVEAAARQLSRQVKNLWPHAGLGKSGLNRSQFARLLLAGYADRLCKTTTPGWGVMVGGRGVTYDAGPEVPELFLALELSERGEQRVACKADLIVPVELADVEAVLGLREEEGAVYDRERERVRGVRRRVFGDLVLQEKPAPHISEERLAKVLADAAQARFDRVFKPERRARQLIDRLRFAARHLPEESWPDVTDSGLKSLLADHCYGKRKFQELRRLDWFRILNSRLDWKLQSVLDQEVPERIQVPSGSRVTIDYAAALGPAGHPVLAVRLQELFGMADTPRLARGRVPVLLHLLAPNMRPAQITQDLRGFWNATYAEVRKELRQRYPKHAWPEDPWSALPIRGVPRKRKQQN